MPSAWELVQYGKPIGINRWEHEVYSLNGATYALQEIYHPESGERFAVYPSEPMQGSNHASL